MSIITGTFVTAVNVQRKNNKNEYAVDITTFFKDKNPETITKMCTDEEVNISAIQTAYFSNDSKVVWGKFLTKKGKL